MGNLVMHLKNLLQSIGTRVAGLFRGPRSVAVPEKEVRFTRARQANTFVVIGIVLFCVALALFMSALPGFTGKQRPMVSSYWFTVIPLPLSAVVFWFAMRLTRHAYIILTPLGIEIFPFFRPEKNMSLLYWSEIEDAKVSSDLRLLTVSHSGGSKAFISLDPIRKDQRKFLKRAIDGTIAQRPQPPAAETV